MFVNEKGCLVLESFELSLEPYLEILAYWCVVFWSSMEHFQLAALFRS